MSAIDTTETIMTPENVSDIITTLPGVVSSHVSSDDPRLGWALHVTFEDSQRGQDDCLFLAGLLNSIISSGDEHSVSFFENEGTWTLEAIMIGPRFVGELLTKHMPNRATFKAPRSIIKEYEL